MNWLLLTILAITSRATYSLSARLMGRDVKVSAQTQSFLLNIMVGILALFVSPFVGGVNFLPVFDHTLTAGLIILTLVLGNIIYFKAQKQLDAGTTQVAFSSILVWGTILSIFFLGTKFSFLQLLGIMLMLIAILTVQSRRKNLNLNKDVLFIMISAFLFAIFQVASASVSTIITTGTYLLIISWGTALAIFLLFFKTVISDFKKLVTQVKQAFLITVFAGATSLLYNIFAFLAYRFAPGKGVVVVLLTAQVVLSVILGVIFLKEKDNVPRKIFAGILAFLAGILIHA